MRGLSIWIWGWIQVIMNMSQMSGFENEIKSEMRWTHAEEKSEEEGLLLGYQWERLWMRCTCECMWVTLWSTGMCSQGTKSFTQFKETDDSPECLWSPGSSRMKVFTEPPSNEILSSERLLRCWLTECVLLNKDVSQCSLPSVCVSSLPPWLNQVTVLYCIQSSQGH